MMPRLLRRLNMDGWRLSTSIVVWSLALLMVVQVAVLTRVDFVIDANARSQVSQDLQKAERDWARVVAQRVSRLAQHADAAAKDTGFKDALILQDQETIRSALQTYSGRSGAVVAAQIDNSLSPDKSVIYTETTKNIQIQVGMLEKIAAQLQSSMQAEQAQTPPNQPAKPVGQLAVVQELPYIFVMAPLKTPLQIGWLVMGFAIDDTLAKELLQQSDVSLATTVFPDGASTATVPIKTLPDQALADLQLAGLGSNEFPSQGDTLMVRHIPTPAIGGKVDVLLVRSLDKATEPFKELQQNLLTITAVGLLLFAVGSAWTARRVSTPLRSLVYNAERLGQGKYDQPIKHTQRQDEIGDLANAFDRMRKNIALKQTEIEQLAYWDRLTRLPNRLRFRDTVKEAIADSLAQGGTPPPLAIITLNLDRFKHVNDILGYALGDRLLVAVADRLLAHMDGHGALVARLGSDEFSVLLPGADANAAIAVAQRIVTAFEATMGIDDQTVDLSASLGIACWPQHAQDVDTLLGRAEVAMYVAKRKTTVFQLYDPAFDSTSKINLSLLSELRHAVEHSELRLFLQPKIALSTGLVIAAEALVRWQHPVRGLVPPDSFIPFAEQTGFVRQLTLWMFDEAARQWAGLQQPGQPMRISVNLSTRDLLDLDFPARLDVLLAKHGVAPEGFCLEITESAIMDDPLRAEGTLKRLSDRGFKLSIDDFGTGYSSLAYLKRLPVDELKIDKSFVMGMEKDPDDAKIVRSTIDLAHNMGLSVVAEGVENAAILALLREQGCDEAQGYHMSKPLPVDAFKAWCARWQVA